MSTAISIHAPAKGATCHTGRPVKGSNDFNPRSREGSDEMIGARSRLPTFQSTLPRRERPVKKVSLPLMLHFNPRSREGSDPRRTPGGPSPQISIHAPAKGATLRGRIREKFGSISIHAPAKGATRAYNSSLPDGDFNPRSREGSDFNRFFHFHFSFYFNPRSREGSDPKVGETVLSLYLISIHAPAKGATPGSSSS